MEVENLHEGRKGSPAQCTHLFNLCPLLSDGCVRRLPANRPDGGHESHWGQPPEHRLVTQLVLGHLFLLQQDVSLDLLGQFLQCLFGFPESPLVVFADPGQIVLQGGRGVPGRTLLAAPSSPFRRVLSVSPGPGLVVGGRLQGGAGVEQDPAEQLGGVGQEEDRPEAKRDEGAEHQQQHELLRQAEGGGARPLPATAAAAAAETPAQATPHGAAEKRQQAPHRHRARRRGRLAARCPVALRRAAQQPNFAADRRQRLRVWVLRIQAAQTPRLGCRYPLGEQLPSGSSSWGGSFGKQARATGSRMQTLRGGKQ